VDNGFDVVSDEGCVTNILTSEQVM
jgi:hypothetical protein